MKSWLLGLAVAVTCNAAQAQETTATGHGGSFNEALQNAKVLATEYVASTFVTGRQDLVNGKYKEVLGQYNGGLIQKYTVKDTVVADNLYAVTILADINTDKVNEIVTSGREVSNTVVFQVEKAVDEYNQTSNGWSAINQASKPFAVVPEGSEYSVYQGQIVNAIYHLRLLWNPKWIDDARQLTKAIGRSPIGGPETKTLCFTRPAQVRECGGVMVLPNVGAWDKLNFVATISFVDGTSEKEYFRSNAARQMYTDGLIRLTEEGWLKPIITTPAIVLHQDKIAKFEFRTSFTTSRFKTVSSVTIDPVF
jgi:hypothetical protein